MYRSNGTALGSRSHSACVTVHRTDPYGQSRFQTGRYLTQSGSSLGDFSVHCYSQSEHKLSLATSGRGQGMNPTKSGSVASSETPAGARRDTLTITDNRTGRQYEIPVTNDTIRADGSAPDQGQRTDFGMMSYDPAFANTASCTSKITYIDGDKGILRYRGYSIEELAEKSTYLETAYLILYGELPTQVATGGLELPHHASHLHSREHQEISRRLSLRCPPDGDADLDVAALSTFYPDAKDIFNPDSRRKQTYRLIGKMPTLAAFAYRHSLGMPFAYPDNDLSYCRQFPEHAVPHHRVEIPAESNARTRARHSVHSARRPRTELFVHRDARRRAARTSIPIPPRPRPPPRCTARCTAARTRRCCACWSRSGR